MRIPIKNVRMLRALYLLIAKKTSIAILAV
jgi:hypothetical protein